MMPVVAVVNLPLTALLCPRLAALWRIQLAGDDGGRLMARGGQSRAWWAVVRDAESPRHPRALGAEHVILRDADSPGTAIVVGITRITGIGPAQIAADILGRARAAKRGQAQTALVTLVGIRIRAKVRRRTGAASLA